MMRLALLCALSIAFAAQAFTAKTLRFGQLTDLQMVETVTFEWNADDYGPEPTLESGEKFAVVTLELRPQRSIGKYDYTLSGAKCLALTVQGQPLRPDTWEIVGEADGTVVELVYKVPADEAVFTMSFDYPELSSLPTEEKHIIINLLPPAEPAAAASDEAPAEGATSTEAAPGEPPAAEAPPVEAAPAAVEPAPAPEAKPAEPAPAAEAKPEAPAPAPEAKPAAKPAPAKPAKPTEDW